MAVDDLGDDVGEVGLRIDGIEFAAFDQRCDDCPMLGSAIGAGEERILPVQCYRPDAALDDIAIDLDPPVVDEVGETVPTREGITDCLSELGLLADQGELCAKPAFRPSMIDRLLSWRTARRSSALRPRMSFSTA